MSIIDVVAFHIRQGKDAKSAIQIAFAIPNQGVVVPLPKSNWKDRATHGKRARQRREDNCACGKIRKSLSRGLKTSCGFGDAVMFGGREIGQQKGITNDQMLLMVSYRRDQHREYRPVNI